MKKVVIISGGTEGLGQNIAEILSSKYTVIILARSKSALKKTAEKLLCYYEVCDISDSEQVKSTVQKIAIKHKRIDCVINNAALWIEGKIEENDPVYMQKVVNTNIIGTMFLTPAVIPYMKTQQIGRVINIISQAGFYGKAERSVYTATKFALTGFTNCLQTELAKHGIGVTGLYPGKMKTKMFEKMGIRKEMSDALDPIEVAKTIEFILSFENSVTFPEIGIKNLEN